MTAELRVPYRQSNHLIGVRFGRLTVLERNGRHGNDAAWHCRCDCGCTVTMTTKVLRETARRGGTSSCGCFRSQRARELGEASRQAAIDRRVTAAAAQKADQSERKSSQEVAALDLARALGML